MPGGIILNEDWSEYDKIKRSRNEDVALFNCSEEWEVAYLIQKLQERFDFLLSDSTVQKAISACCKVHHDPVNRRQFVDCVIAHLIS